MSTYTPPSSGTAHDHVTPSWLPAASIQPLPGMHVFVPAAPAAANPSQKGFAYSGPAKKTKKGAGLTINPPSYNSGIHDAEAAQQIDEVSGVHVLEGQVAKAESLPPTMHVHSMAQRDSMVSRTSSSVSTAYSDIASDSNQLYIHARRRVSDNSGHMYMQSKSREYKATSGGPGSDGSSPQFPRPFWEAQPHISAEVARPPDPPANGVAFYDPENHGRNPYTASLPQVAEEPTAVEEGVYVMPPQSHTSVVPAQALTGSNFTQPIQSTAWYQPSSAAYKQDGQAFGPFSGSEAFPFRNGNISGTASPGASAVSNSETHYSNYYAAQAPSGGPMTGAPIPDPSAYGGWSSARTSASNFTNTGHSLDLPHPQQYGSEHAQQVQAAAVDLPRGPPGHTYAVHGYASSQTHYQTLSSPQHSVTSGASGSEAHASSTMAQHYHANGVIAAAAAKSGSQYSTFPQPQPFASPPTGSAPYVPDSPSAAWSWSVAQPPTTLSSSPGQVQWPVTQVVSECPARVDMSHSYMPEAAARHTAQWGQAAESVLHAWVPHADYQQQYQPPPASPSAANSVTWSDSNALSATASGIYPATSNTSVELSAVATGGFNPHAEAHAGHDERMETLANSLPYSQDVAQGQQWGAHSVAYQTETYHQDPAAVAPVTAGQTPSVLRAAALALMAQIADSVTADAGAVPTAAVIESAEQTSTMTMRLEQQEGQVMGPKSWLVSRSRHLVSSAAAYLQQQHLKGMAGAEAVHTGEGLMAFLHPRKPSYLDGPLPWELPPVSSLSLHDWITLCGAWSRKNPGKSWSAELMVELVPEVAALIGPSSTPQGLTVLESASGYASDFDPKSLSALRGAVSALGKGVGAAMASALSATATLGGVGERVLTAWGAARVDTYCTHAPMFDTLFYEACAMDMEEKLVQAGETLRETNVQVSTTITEVERKVGNEWKAEAAQLNARSAPEDVSSSGARGAGGMARELTLLSLSMVDEQQQDIHRDVLDAGDRSLKSSDNHQPWPHETPDRANVEVIQNPLEEGWDGEDLQLELGQQGSGWEGWGVDEALEQLTGWEGAKKQSVNQSIDGLSQTTSTGEGHNDGDGWPDQVVSVDEPTRGDAGVTAVASRGQRQDDGDAGAASVDLSRVLAGGVDDELLPSSAEAQGNGWDVDDLDIDITLGSQAFVTDQPAQSLWRESSGLQAQVGVMAGASHSMTSEGDETVTDVKSVQSNWITNTVFNAQEGEVLGYALGEHVTQPAAGIGGIAVLEELSVGIYLEPKTIVEAGFLPANAQVLTCGVVAPDTHEEEGWEGEDLDANLLLQLEEASELQTAITFVEGRCKERSTEHNGSESEIHYEVSRDCRQASSVSPCVPEYEHTQTNNKWQEGMMVSQPQVESSWLVSVTSPNAISPGVAKPSPARTIASALQPDVSVNKADAQLASSTKTGERTPRTSGVDGMLEVLTLNQERGDSFGGNLTNPVTADATCTEPVSLLQGQNVTLESSTVAHVLTASAEAQNLAELQEQYDLLQGEFDELLLCLGQETAKVAALSEMLEQLGVDPVAVVERVEREWVAM